MAKILFLEVEAHGLYLRPGWLVTEDNNIKSAVRGPCLKFLMVLHCVLRIVIFEVCFCISSRGHSRKCRTFQKGCTEQVEVKVRNNAVAVTLSPELKSFDL